MVLGGLRVVGGGLWLIGGGLLLVEGGQLASVVGEREVVALHHQAADAAAQHLTHARLATLKRYSIIYAVHYLKNTYSCPSRSHCSQTNRTSFYFSYYQQ